MLRDRYPTEDEYWDALMDARYAAEDRAMLLAERSAESIEFDDDDEREEYTQRYFDREYKRLCAEYERDAIGAYKNAP